MKFGTSIVNLVLSAVSIYFAALKNNSVVVDAAKSYKKRKQVKRDKNCSHCNKQDRGKFVLKNIMAGMKTINRK